MDDVIMIDVGENTGVVIVMNRIPIGHITTMKSLIPE